MKKDTYQVISAAGNHEYTIKVSNKKERTVYSLYRSNSEEWVEHVRGQQVFSITDHGNGMILPKLAGEYDEVTELFILLSFINRMDSMFKGQIVKQETVLSL